MNARAFDAHSMAAALGGDVAGPDAVIAPGPDHSPHDRSLSIKIAPDHPDGFVVHSHSRRHSHLECKDYVRQKLGVPAWTPRAKAERRPQARSSVRLGPLVASYIYQGADRANFLRVRRFAPRPHVPGANKTFLQDHWTGSAWEKGAPKGPKIPYRLPELLDAPGRTILVVEGEKDADRLAALGALATTSSGGAEGWKPELAPWFAGRRVVILPDNDDPGRAYARQVAASLHAVGAKVRVLALPGLPEKGDVSDWLDAGGDRGAFKALCSEAPEWAPDAEPSLTDGASDPTSADPPAWLEECILDGRNKKPIANLANVMVALRHDPALLDAVALDRMATLPMLTRTMPDAGRAGAVIAARPVTDQDAGALQEYLQWTGLARVSREIVFQALEMRAHECAFHPVQDYLAGITWDGTPRLDAWLSTVVSAEVVDFPV